MPNTHNREPDLHQLRVFEGPVREHSLTRAAHASNVTQPALSKTLAQLHRYFGDPLFVRVALRMKPTVKAFAARQG
jgi:DNA-binding transcriptional LysR family regulator